MVLWRLFSVWRILGLQTTEEEVIQMSTWRTVLANRHSRGIGWDMPFSHSRSAQSAEPGVIAFHEKVVAVK
jgi:hypothetical protein